MAQNALYTDYEKIKIIRDIPKISKQSGETLEEVAQREFIINRQTYYKYRKIVKSILNQKGKNLIDLKTMTNDDIKELLTKRDTTQVLTHEKSQTKGLLQNLKSDISQMEKEKTTVKPPPQQTKSDDMPDNTLSDKPPLKMNWKWLLIGGGGIFLVLTLVSLFKKGKSATTHTTDEESIETATTHDIDSKYIPY